MNKNYEMQIIHVYMTMKLCGQEEFSPSIKNGERYLKIQSITISTLFINKCSMELQNKKDKWL